MNRFLSEQFPNLFLWSPFFLAAGAIAYFSCPFEPIIPVPWIMSIVIACATIFTIWFYRTTKYKSYFLALISCLLLLFGFVYADATTHNLNTQFITHDLRDTNVRGIVRDIDFVQDKTRVFVKLNGDNTDSANVMARLSFRAGDTIPQIDDTVDLTATMFRPGAADAPNSFDMAEYAYFGGFGATGYPTKVTVVRAGSGNTLANLRDNIHTKIAQHKNQTATQLVDSLVLGHNNAMPKSDAAAARGAGISHVFSISGFHMTLIGGWFFVLFYLIFRSIPRIANRIPARIPALVATWIILLFYLSISGAMAATMRSFIMATLGFVALGFSRHVVSLRNVCIAFGLLLLFNPHYVMDVGFRLSFAAIFGLTYFFDGAKYEHLSRLQKLRHIVISAILGTIVATIFTMPFIATTFHNVQIYGVLGNLICVPIFSFVIMPLVIIGAFSGAVFGIFAPLDWCVWSYKLVMRASAWISALPNANINIPYIPPVALALLVIAMLAMMFLITNKRIKIIIVSALTLCSLLIAVYAPRPIFYASRDHDLVAFMRDNGALQFNHARNSANYMAFDTWNEYNGDGPSVPTLRKPLRSGFSGTHFAVRCDTKICTYTTPKWTLIFAEQFVPLYRAITNGACNDARFIVSYFHIYARGCHAEIPRGGFMIYENGDVKSVIDSRAWHRISKK